MTAPPAQVLEMYIPGVPPQGPGVNIFCGQPSHLMAPVPPPTSSVATSHPLSVGAPGLVPHLQHVQSSAAIYQMNQQFLSAATASSVMTQQPVLPGSMYVAAPIASSSIRIQPPDPATGVGGGSGALDLQSLDPSSGLISFPGGAQFPILNGVGVGMPAGIVAPANSMVANVAVTSSDRICLPSDPVPSSRPPYSTRHANTLPVSVNDSADPSPLRQRLSDVLKRKKPSISKRANLRR